MCGAHLGGLGRRAERSRKPERIGRQWGGRGCKTALVSLGVEFSLIVGAENSLAGAWPGGLGRAPDLRAVRPSPIIPSDMIRIGGWRWSSSEN